MAILTVINMKKLIEYAEKLGISHYDIIKLNDPFLVLNIPPTSKNEKSIEVLVSNLAVKTKISIDPIEEIL